MNDTISLLEGEGSKRAIIVVMLDVWPLAATQLAYMRHTHDLIQMHILRINVGILMLLGVVRAAGKCLAL